MNRIVLNGLLFWSLFFLVFQVQAGDYTSVRCDYTKGLSTSEKLMDVAFRRFKKQQENCCNSTVVDACKKMLTYKSCKALAAGGFAGAECPSECKAWSEDCHKYVSTSDKILKEKFRQEGEDELNEIMGEN